MRLGPFMTTAALIAAMSSSVQALPTCVELSTFLADGDNRAAFKGADTCRTTRQLGGGSAYHCAWSYPYRSKHSRTALQTFLARIESCEGVARSTQPETGVNHPDTYEQWVFRVAGRTISVSLKDKAQLDRSYLFLGISADPDREAD